MKRYNWIYLLMGLAGIFLSSCHTDSTDFTTETSDVYIDSVWIEAANNSSFLDEDIVASVTNYARTIVATLPNEAEGEEVVLTIFTEDGITTNPASGDAITTGTSSLLVSGYGLEEEYTVTLEVLEPYQSDEEFVTTWSVEAGEEITLPLIATGSYNFKVFWGDDESSIVAAYDLESASHTYSEAGEYSVIIWGDIEGFNFYETDASAENIIDITSWGQVKLGNDEAYFRGCSNLQISATDAPDLSETTTLKAIFRDATSFNSEINHWDLSTITSTQDAFYKATNFNQALDEWDVSGVTTFESMFRESAFNQDISGWDMSSATTLKSMLRDCPFNQPVGDWDISNVTSLYSTFRGNDAFDQDLSGWGDKLANVSTMRELFRESDFNGDLSAWDVSGITSMWDMFKNSGFNNSSISNWDVSGLDNMETIFGGEDCAFNQDISAWDVSNVVNMQNLFQDNVVFNQDLSGWDVSSVKCNYNFDDGATAWEEAYKPNFTSDSTDDNEFCDRDI